MVESTFATARRRIMLRAAMTTMVILLVFGGIVLVLDLADERKTAIDERTVELHQIGARPDRAECGRAGVDAAHADQRNNQLRIINNHCPFGDVAIEHPVICAVDRGMVKGMLGALYGETTPEMASSLPNGDDTTASAPPRPSRVPSRRRVSWSRPSPSSPRIRSASSMTRLRE